MKYFKFTKLFFCVGVQFDKNYPILFQDQIGNNFIAELFNHFQTSFSSENINIILHNIYQNKVYFLQVLAKHFQPVLQLITLSALSFVYLDLNWCKNLLVRDLEWSESCSSWPENMPHQLFLWMKLILLDLLVLNPVSYY